MIQNVIYRRLKALGLIDPPRASHLGPESASCVDDARLPQIPCAPRFQLTHHILRRMRGRLDQNVDVIRSHIECMHAPVPMCAVGLDRSLNNPTPLHIKKKCLLCERDFTPHLANRIGLEKGGAPSVVLIIDGTALIAVEPRAVGGPCQEIDGEAWHCFDQDKACPLACARGSFDQRIQPKRKSRPNRAGSFVSLINLGSHLG